MTDQEIEEKYGTKIYKKLCWYSNSSYRYTRDYLLSKILDNNITNIPKGALLKEDFLEQYYLSRSGEIDLPLTIFRLFRILFLGKELKFRYL